MATRASQKATEIDVDGVAVRFTNPDKVYFPKLGAAGTKGKVMEYYRAVAAGPLLTALARPPDPSAALPRRHRGRGDSPEAGSREAS